MLPKACEEFSAKAVKENSVKFLVFEQKRTDCLMLKSIPVLSLILVFEQVSEVIAGKLVSMHHKLR
jgi:hypothetical protein